MGKIKCTVHYAKYYKGSYVGTNLVIYYDGVQR